MRNILPTRDQWRNWSLPSKYAALGLLLTFLSFIIALIFNLISLTQVDFRGSEESANHGPNEVKATVPERSRHGEKGEEVLIPPAFEEDVSKADGLSQEEATIVSRFRVPFNPLTFDEFWEGAAERAGNGLRFNAFIEQYLGKGLIWEGTVARISSSGEEIEVLARTDSAPPRYAFLYFGTEHYKAFYEAREGASIRAACIFREFDSHASKLVQCALLKLG